MEGAIAMEVAALVRAISQAGAPAAAGALIPGEGAPKGEERGPHHIQELLLCTPRGPALDQLAPAVA